VVEVDGGVFVHFVSVDYVGEVGGDFLEEIQIGCFVGKLFVTDW
jgi:hypothetical protein